jgi:hypothetical protein
MGGGGLFADKVAASGGSAGGTTGNTTGAGDSALHKRRGASEMSASEAGGDEAGGANQRCGGLGDTQAAAACASPASLAGSSRLRRLILTPLAALSNSHKRACGASFVVLDVLVPATCSARARPSQMQGGAEGQGASSRLLRPFKARPCVEQCA